MRNMCFSHPTNIRAKFFLEFLFLKKELVSAKVIRAATTILMVLNEEHLLPSCFLFSISNKFMSFLFFPCVLYKDIGTSLNLKRNLK
jgi:hypothetical protein